MIFNLFKVGVHIADVSHFIRPGNALDQESARRGTTVYLCEKVNILNVKPFTDYSTFAFCFVLIGTGS